MKIILFKFIVLCLAFFSIDTKPEPQQWLSTCDNCLDAISNCLSCSEEKNCQKCIKSINPKCNHCSKDLFSQNDGELDQEGYFFCDQSVILQEYICRIRCRGALYQFGECVKSEETSVCQCFDATPLSTSQTTITTTKHPFVQRNITFRVFAQEPTYINDFKVLPNGDLVAAEYNGQIRILDPTGEAKSTIYAHSGPVWSIDILENGDLVSGGDDKTIKIWDLSTNSVKIQLNGHTGLVRVVKSLSNGLLASGSTDNSVKIWNAADGSLVTTLIGHSNHIQDLVILSNGDLASGSKDKTVKIWDIQTGKLKYEFNENFNQIWRLALLKSGDILIVEMDKNFRSVDPITGENKIHFIGHTSMPRDLAILDNGDIATGDSAQVIIIWDSATGYIKKLFNKNPSSYDSYDIVRSLVVAQTGDLIGAFENKKLKIWNTGQGPF